MTRREGFVWRRLRAEQVDRLDRDAVDAATLAAAAEIVNEVKRGGEPAVRRLAEHYGDLRPGAPLHLGAHALAAALDSITGDVRELLERTAERIATFARAQREALHETTIAVPGGSAGHQIAAVERAGCYAPGGRYPLPSSVLMTVVTARTAGVPEVWLASPRPTPVTLAAAAIAGADGVLAAGGAHAVAALVFGAGDLPPCQVVVGPGNRWVTAAKQLLAGRVGIDTLAGPSELVVLADDDAEPATVAADLLAQAEHDPDALPVLVTTSAKLAHAVEEAIDAQLTDLVTREVAIQALGNGFAVVASCLDEAIAVCDRLAPEHLEVMTADPQAVATRLQHWGGLFIGAGSAEVFGDYGAGPNHTLPTGGVARFAGGLSVLDFLRVRTWLEISEPDAAGGLIDDAIALARIEGLEGHARAAEHRLR